MIKSIAKVFNSATEPEQISMALCLSIIAGFTPGLSFHNLIILLLVLVLRVNLIGFGIGWALFSFAAYLLTPLFHRIGLVILTAPSLTAFWTELYNTSWFRLDRLNNTVVMGSLFFSLALFVPCLLLFTLLIRRFAVSGKKGGAA